MPPIRALEPDRARRTLLARLAGTPERPGVIDKARQIATNLGARPYRVFLVWTRWTGERRGEGQEGELARFELLPTPKVEDMTSVAMNPYSAGKIPVGAVRVSEVSAGRHSEDVLRGLVIPPLYEPRADEDDFFYEVMEDGRNTNAPVERKRFRLMAGPHLSSCCTQYSFVLDRSAKDETRAGVPQGGEIEGDLR